MSAYTETDETVRELLEDTDAFPRRPRLHMFVGGVMAAEQLSYEEWVHPLRATGGQIALKWEAVSYDSWGYVWYDPRGLVYTFETAGHRYEGPDGVNCFKETMRMVREGEETISVVLKDEIDE